MILLSPDIKALKNAKCKMQNAKCRVTSFRFYPIKCVAELLYSYRQSRRINPVGSIIFVKS